MCNIAGYIGNRPAAPILIEMLRRQEWLDGGLSTGIATIHEGKLYYAKVVGDVDTLVRQTEALSFPGTIGIIHSRPDGNFQKCAQPFVNEEKTIAIVENGNCCRDEESIQRQNAVADLLYDKSVNFPSLHRYERSSYPQLKNGDYVSYAEVAVEYISHLRKTTGESFEKIMADVCTEMYADIVGVMVTTERPENIFVTRISRPMNIMLAGGETYLATSQFGFPEVDHVDYMASLPQLRSCVISKDGFTVTNHAVAGGCVREFSSAEFMEAYCRTKEALSRETVNIDELGKYLFTEPNSLMRDGLRPRAKFMYDVLYELSKNGKLTMTTEERELPWLAGTGQSRVNRYSFKYEENKSC